LARRPLADVLIGAFASRYQGLITRNTDDFASIFPDLKVGVPAP
jgi:predicted nucleic acid-binding protein